MYFVPFAQPHSNRCWYYIFGFCPGVSLMAPARVGMPPLLPSLVRGYRLGPNLALYCWLCRLCRDVWKRCGFYSAVAQWPWFLVPPAMRLVMACFQGAFFWLCRFWLAFCASDFALAGQPSRYLFLVPFAQRHSNRCWCYIFWALPRRFAMPPWLQGALLPYAALGLWPPSYRLRALP